LIALFAIKILVRKMVAQSAHTATN